MSDPVDALRAALAAAPDNAGLRLALADLLASTGRSDEALAELRALAITGALPPDRVLAVGQMALDASDLPLVERCLALAGEHGLVQGVSALRDALLARRAEQGVVTLRVVDGAEASGSADIDADVPPVRFEDVGGLADLKKVIHRRIILPFTRPGLLQRYRKKAGGGVLLYGPPGCGKTLIARATAGECGLPFAVVRIDEILSPYIGVSEQNLHACFDQARATAPCVLFLDEIDAIGFSRSRMRGESHRGLVDQLLQELDGMSDRNEDVLVLAATNAPWDLDDALLRPGRFDRTIFVPPPDAEARAEILAIHLQDRPVDRVDAKALAARTDRFSGADLQGLVERAFDEVIEEALETGEEPPARMDHFEAALRDLRPSSAPWLERARNYVEFANRDERWDDVARYLGVKKGWRLF